MTIYQQRFENLFIKKVVKMYQLLEMGEDDSDMDLRVIQL